MTTIAENVDASIIKKLEGNSEIETYGIDMCFIRIDGTPHSQPRHRYSVRNGRVFNYDPAHKDKEKFKKELVSRCTSRVSGCVCLSLTFYMPRPKHHYRTGKYKHLLKKGSPRLHTIKPDIDNLIKFVMDCGQNILWNDDSTICQIESKKIYSKHPRTEIEYWKCPKDNG